MPPEAAPSTPLEHLRVERPSDGVVRLVLDNPDQRNAMSDEMTASWVRAIDELAADRSVRVVVVTGEGTAFCSGGNTGWIASEPDAEVDYLRTRMIGVLPCLALDPAARGADHRGRQRTGDRRRAVPGPRLRHPVRRGGRQARRALRQAGDEPRHGRDVPAARRGRRGQRPRAAAHRPHRGRRGGAAARAWSRGSSRRDAFAGEVDEIAEGIAATAPIPSRYTTLALRGGGHRDLESCVQWEALAQPITLATADLQEGIRAAKEKRSPRFRGV